MRPVAAKGKSPVHRPKSHPRKRSAFAPGRAWPREAPLQTPGAVRATPRSDEKLRLYPQITTLNTAAVTANPTTNLVAHRHSLAKTGSSASSTVAAAGVESDESDIMVRGNWGITKTIPLHSA